MSAQLPTITETVDNAFTHTWFKIQKKVTDNILDNNVFSALLREHGCYKKQIGEDRINRLVRYGKKAAINVAEGDTLPTGDTELDTMAHWPWTYAAVDVQRSMQQDQQNQGAGKLRSLVQSKLEAAREGLNDLHEANLLRAPTGTGESKATRSPYSIFNVLDPSGTTATYHPTTGTSYTYGNLSTAGDQTAETLNHWWQAKYADATGPALANLLDQMRTMYNNCSGSGGGSRETQPNMGLTTQTLHEAYEDICSANIQLVADTGSRTAELGYDILKFKGMQLGWSGHSYMTDSGVGSVLFMNSNWIDVVYDPTMWFEMTPWMYLPNQLERIARIVMATSGIISWQPRRQGLLGGTASPYTT